MGFAGVGQTVAGGAKTMKDEKRLRIKPQASFAFQQSP